MSAAELGLVGVVVGLMLGRGYEYWAVHRAELGAAIAATAALTEALHESHTPPEQRLATREELDKAWREHRCALTVFMQPSDVRALAEAIRSRSPGIGERTLGELAVRMHELHMLFWTEQQVFILVAFLRLLPPIRQLSRYTSMPDRIHAKLTQQLPPSPDG